MYRISFGVAIKYRHVSIDFSVCEYLISLLMGLVFSIDVILCLLVRSATILKVDIKQISCSKLKHIRYVH